MARDASSDQELSPVTIENASPLALLGWDASWAAAFAAATRISDTSTLDNTSERISPPARPARVIAEHRERYVVAAEDGEHSAVLAGRARHVVSAREDLPAVGDWVGISHASGNGTAVVKFVIPRRSAFVRKTAGDATS